MDKQENNLVKLFCKLAIGESWALFFVSSWSVNLIRVFSMMIHCIS